MTVNDPGPRMTKVRHTYGAAPDPTIIHTTEVRESSAAWWVGALVAIVAILAVVFLVTRPPATSEADIAKAMEQSRLQGALESSQSSLNSAQASATLATERAADASAKAAEDARAATARAADAAATATARVNETVTAPIAAQPVQ